jgi:hypothetical protein
MKKNWVIGVLSMVPGLGLLVLGEVWKGLGAFFLAMLLLLCVFGPWEAVAGAGFALFLVVWIVQGVYAVVFAERRARTEAGLTLPEREVPIAPLPPAASSGQKSLYKARQELLRLLQPDEHLQLAMPAATMKRSDSSLLRELVLSLLTFGPMGEMTGAVYLGVTEHDLVLVGRDMLGKPDELRRIPRSQISSVQSRESLLDDNVVIEIGEDQPLRLRMYRHIREGTRQLVALLSGKEEDGYSASEESVWREETSHAAEYPSMPAAMARHGFISRRPVLASALLGAGGGIAGAVVSPLLAGLLGVLVEAFGGPAFPVEGLAILAGGYCVIMFPFGGGILGAIPGTIVGGLRASRPGRLTIFQPLLAGFLTVVILTLVGVLAILATF